MTGVTGNVVVLESGKDFAKIEANGKIVDLKPTDKVKKFYKKGLDVGKSYWVVYDDETNMLEYVKEQTNKPKSQDLSSFMPKTIEKPKKSEDEDLIMLDRAIKVAEGFHKYAIPQDNYSIYNYIDIVLQAKTELKKNYKNEVYEK